MPTFPEHGYVENDQSYYYYWKASTLWALSDKMLIEHVALDSFDWENDNFQCNALSEPPLWRDIGNQTKQILAADLQYPIIISAEGNIMDGMHRIMKSYVFGLPTIKAVRFDNNPEPDLILPINDAEDN
ncbi:MAG: hypothetical protein WBC91_19375 [Phototrophicaceae bacterium]